MFPNLTSSRCECCDETLVDNVGLVVVCDAVRAFNDELDLRREEREDALEEAGERHRRMLADIKAGRRAAE